MDLDLAVTRCVHQAHQIERALHDPGPWTLAFAGLVVPAQRSFEDDSVVFTAEFPMLAEVEPGILELRCGRDLVGTRLIDPPDDTEFEVEWALTLHESVAA